MIFTHIALVVLVIFNNNLLTAAPIRIDYPFKPVLPATVSVPSTTLQVQRISMVHFLAFQVYLICLCQLPKAESHDVRGKGSELLYSQTQMRTSFADCTKFTPFLYSL